MLSENALGLRVSGLSPVARAHAGPRAKLDKRLLNGSVSESLTTRSLKTVFGNDKLRFSSNFSDIWMRKACQMVATERIAMISSAIRFDPRISPHSVT